MRTILRFIAILIVTAVASGCVTNSPKSECCPMQAKVYRHVVMFKFKTTATPAQIGGIVADFGKLPEKINTIKGYEWGTNVSPEGLDRGLTHCFIVSFADRAGLDVYLPHPEHKAFVAKLLPLLEEAVVVDFVPSP